MAVSGEKMIDCLDTLEAFIQDKLPLICECKLEPTDIVFMLSQLLWEHHRTFDTVVTKRRGRS